MNIRNIVINQTTVSMRTNSGAYHKVTGKYIPPSIASKDEEYICITCSKDLILRKGTVRIPHFSHKIDDDVKCSHYSHTNEEDCHKDAKELLKEILDEHYQLCINCVHCKFHKNTIKKVGEKSSISIEHKFTLNGTRKSADVAYLQDGDLKYIFEICNTSKTMDKNRPTDIEWYEFDATSLVARLDEADKKSKKMTIECMRKSNCMNCNKVEQQTTVAQFAEKGTIYYNQRGAGCGKTYESIQLLQNDERFILKDTFIYLTKAHSAKDVIYSELKEQENNGFLSNLEMTENKIVSKQYKVTFNNVISGRSITVIIGTVDSFTYAINDKDEHCEDGNDYFMNIVKNIKRGNISVGSDQTVWYTQQKTKINQTCLIIIDEAQDLNKIYIEAFNTIVQQTKIDVYLIGDKLQSIWGGDTIFNFIENATNDTVIGMNIVKTEGINVCLRMHNEKLKEFVNSIIPFEKYNLPKITGICDGKRCKYIHENDTNPIEINEIIEIYGNDINCKKKGTKFGEIVKYIIEKIDFEVKKYNYLPKNFMIIFPVLKNNPVATMLLTQLQEFWIRKFSEKSYQENVLSKDIYWKSHPEINEGIPFAFLHKSEDGRSINLSDSENSTRILSIHSSKGNGCEVVFCVGITENSLKIFSKETSNLLYDSLLHVAITRQKKSLYMTVVRNNDDIHRRIRKSGLIIRDNKDIEPNILCIKKTIKLEYIVSSMLEQEETFKKINDNCINEKYDYLLSKDQKNAPIIDMGDHECRYSTFLYRYLFNIMINNSYEDSQIIAVFRNISFIETEQHQCVASYNKKLWELTRIQKEDYDLFMKKRRYLILNLDRHNGERRSFSVSTSLEKLIDSVKLKTISSIGAKKMPIFCPIESLVFYYMLNVSMKWAYSDISIMEMYKIINCYADRFETESVEHTNKYRCPCQEIFTKNGCGMCNTMSCSITEHYKSLDDIDRLFINVNKCVEKFTPSSKLTYNVLHYVQYSGNNNDFQLGNQFTLIANSPEFVIVFTIKPQLNILNIKEIVCRSMCETIILKNASKGEDNNYEKNNELRFQNKKIIHCILTFNSIEPFIIYETDSSIADNVIKECMVDRLFHNYSGHHQLMFDFYTYWKFNKPDNTNSVEHTIKILDNNKKLPGYLVDYFDDIASQIDKCHEDEDSIIEVLRSVNEYVSFKNNIDILLNSKLKRHFGLNNKNKSFDF